MRGGFTVSTTAGGKAFRAESEFLLERTNLEFHRPGAAVLMGQMPVRLGDRIGLQQIFLLQLRQAFAPAWDVDAPIDVDPRDMNALGTEVARQRLREPAHRELGRAERERLGSRLHARRRARKEHYAAPARNHVGGNFLGAEKR